MTAGRTWAFELLLTSDKAGRFYWRDLKVERIYTSMESSEQYWSEKLATQGTFYTGLVVDARHLDVRRWMSPRIYSESGQLLYGGVLAGQDLVQDRGVVGYGTELTSELLGRITIDSEYPYVAPLVVQAVRVADAARTGGDCQRRRHAPHSGGHGPVRLLCPLAVIFGEVRFCPEDLEDIPGGSN